MDISSIGMQYLNSEYIPFSASPAAVQGINSGESSAFAGILKKVQNSEAIVGERMKTQIDKTDKLYELCVELETFLIKNLIKSMRSTVQKSELINSGFAGEMYEDMLYDEYAKDFTRNANFGFAELAYRDLAGLR